MKHTSHLFTIILVILLTACQQDSTNNAQLNNGEKLRLLTYGGPPDLESRVNAKNVVAEKWGIEFVSAAGCEVTEELVDSVDRHNKKVETLIEAKYGKSWRLTFNKEVNEELRKQNVIYKLLNKEKRIIDKQKALEKKGNGLHYQFKKRNNATYFVRVSGWGQINGKDEYVSYFRYVVDIEKKQVKLTSDRVIQE
jgi:hypothetical protein